MVRYKIILAYDGTDFSGFQRQSEVRTVQAEFETALAEIGWQGSKITAAGRTDAGVHASGQVVAFDLDWKHTDANLLNALNAKLLPDLAAQEVIQVDKGFHPRYDALARRYRYTILCQPQRDPLQERYAWRVWPEPDRKALEEAAEQLVGQHNFGAFGSPMKKGGVTVREVFETTWQHEGDHLWFEVEANAFLYHMVRRIVNIQIKIAQGFKAMEVITRSLSDPQIEIQGLAPASGLSLIEVKYE